MGSIKVLRILIYTTENSLLIFIHWDWDIDYEPGFRGGRGWGGLWNIQIKYYSQIYDMTYRGKIWMEIEVYESSLYWW